MGTGHLDANRNRSYGEGPEPTGEDWMSWIEDGRLLSNISIPGTHDSGAYTYNVPFIATQRMDIRQQLNSGIRYFDLRCGLKSDVLEMVHGPTFLGLRLENVLSVMYEWLISHPSEALIVQLKKDREDDASTMSFSQAVINNIDLYPQYWRTTNTTPLLGELRGRIQLLRRFRGDAMSAYGINVSRWQDNPGKPFTMHVGHDIKVTVQDHYRYTEAEPLPSLVSKKLAEVLQVMVMASGNRDIAHWYINFTSALEFNWSYRYPPREIAEGGRFGFKRVQGVNDGLAEYLQPRKIIARYGILAMDFPDSNEELIKNLIMSNFCLRTTTLSIKILLVSVCLLMGIIIAWLLMYRDSVVFIRRFIANAATHS